MNCIINIPDDVERRVNAHLFSSTKEEAAFLFASVEESADELRFVRQEAYLVPPEGWESQHEYYLEMTDQERSRIMKMAMDGHHAVIDCHSHPGSGDSVAFSPTDRQGITEFAGYVKWKLRGTPYAAIVWAERSIDAVAWHGDFSRPVIVSEIYVDATPPRVTRPTGSWFQSPFSV